MSQELNLENNLTSGSEVSELQEFKWSKNKTINRIEHYFKFDKFKTTIKKEIIGGLSTFLAMGYLLSLLPEKLHSVGSINGVEAQHLGIFGLFIAVVIISFLATFLMGLFANIPVALSPGLGLLAMFMTTAATKISGDTILGYEGALIATFFSAIIFTIISLTPIRAIILRAIPYSLNVAIGVGIGLFLAYIGISDLGWIQVNGGLPTASMSKLADNYPAILLGTFVLILMFFLNFKKVPGALIISLLIGFIVAVFVANIWPNLSVSKGQGAFANANFKENGGWSYHFDELGGNIKNTWQEFTNPLIWKSPTFYISIFLFIFLNFFDATGSLSTCNLLINKKTKLQQAVSQKAMVIDSASSILGTAIGVSPMSSCLESTAGIEQGARTGFASLISSLGFLLAIAFFPIFKAIPGSATGAAMIFVGLMVFRNITEIDWKKSEFLISTFFLLIFMIITYSVVNGIVIGILAYALTMLGTGKYRQVHPMIWVLSVLFVLYFVGYAFMQIS